MAEKDTTGIFTVEGNVAGSAALKLAKQREKQLASFEQKKQELSAQSRVPHIQDVNARFKKEVISSAAKQYKKQTYGLKTREEFVRLKELEKSAQPLQKKGVSKRERKRRQREEQRAKKQKLLSFDHEDEEKEEEDSDQKVATFVKDPTVRTDFLPDRDRDVRRKQEMQDRKKAKLAQEEERKKEEFTVKFSLFDGMDHAFQVKMRKDQTVMEFLEAAREACATDFPEMKKHAAIDLMYVKRNLILPTSMSFFELMKLRTRAAPLFSLSDNNETTEGLVCIRFWYDRHKHIYPADRWESYHEDKVEQIDSS